MQWESFLCAVTQCCVRRKALFCSSPASGDRRPLFGICHLHRNVLVSSKRSVRLSELLQCGMHKNNKKHLTFTEENVPAANRVCLLN